MNKTYIKPVVKEFNVTTANILAGSGEGVANGSNLGDKNPGGGTNNQFTKSNWGNAWED